MTKKVPPGGQKMNFGKNQLHEVDQRAMPIGKMVLLLILPFGNPKSANGRHPYLRKLFPFRLFNKLQAAFNLNDFISNFNATRINMQGGFFLKINKRGDQNKAVP